MPLLSVKMAHPSALDADGVARVIVFSHKGPPKLTAPATTAPAGALSQDGLLHGVFHQRSSKHTEGQPHNEEEDHKLKNVLG